MAIMQNYTVDTSAFVKVGAGVTSIDMVLDNMASIEERPIYLVTWNNEGTGIPLVSIANKYGVELSRERGLSISHTFAEATDVYVATAKGIGKVLV